MKGEYLQRAYRSRRGEIGQFAGGWLANACYAGVGWGEWAGTGHASQPRSTCSTAVSVVIHALSVLAARSSISRDRGVT
jgi:hypothetical protein